MTHPRTGHRERSILRDLASRPDGFAPSKLSLEPETDFVHTFHYRSLKTLERKGLVAFEPSGAWGPIGVRITPAGEAALDAHYGRDAEVVGRPAAPALLERDLLHHATITRGGEFQGTLSSRRDWREWSLWWEDGSAERHPTYAAAEAAIRRRFGSEVRAVIGERGRTFDAS